jgi:ATP-dependent RNA helicase RhlE
MPSDPSDPSTPFASLGLSPDLARTVQDLGYATPTPIQRQAIPLVLARRDLIAIAQTGTGKTAAFALPLIQNLLSTPRVHDKAPRALILVPTRELALQVSQGVAAYSKGTGLTSLVLHGGVSYDPQLERLRAGVDVIVATPGRLRDHMQRKNVFLSRLEHLVLDEADRMLDMGFADEVGYIVGKTPKQRQTLLFSATFSPEVRRLAQSLLVKPASIEATPEKVTAQNVTHRLHPVDAARKLDLLFEVIHQHLGEQILVFARTKDKVDEVAKDLISRGLVVIATHGDRTQAHRTKALARFKERKIDILVATDIAARGLDTTDLGIVINYELPNVAEDYVHRIGRTGRAGKSGLAVSLVTQAEVRLLAAVEEVIKFRIPVVPFGDFTPAKFGFAAKPAGRSGKPAAKNGKLKPGKGPSQRRRASR